MKKQSKYAVIAFWIFTSIATSACQGEYSRNVVIDSSFTQDEEETITRAMETWNQVSREYLGYDLILYAGRRHDVNGFNPLEDMGDGYNMIYRFAEPDEYYNLLIAERPQNQEGAFLLGYGRQHDILIFTFNILKEVKSYLSDSDDESSEYLREHQVVVLHELGHWLGLQHIGEIDGYCPIMYSLIYKSTQPILTEKDIQAFCLVYDCNKQP